ncbi:MAG: glucose-1-phosphate thymidylyltransferase [Deltaproteobacteria bacterium]|nr:glucose-1-phosphate thymidylyltransferase [Deltaproteobacteria bacterium]
MIHPEDYFDVSDWEFGDLFEEAELVWEILPRIKAYLQDRIRPNLGVLSGQGPFLTRTSVIYQGDLIQDDLRLVPGDATKGNFKVFHRDRELPGAVVLYGGVTLAGEDISLGEGTVVESGAFLQGPTIIGRQTEVRQGAYIRGSCLIGDHCVVGHVTEIKNSVMLNGAKAGHFAYIGDSILGSHCNLGAGTKLANLKIVRSAVTVALDKKIYETGLRKFGVILGDRTETGCNSVTSPGTLLGPRSIVGANVTVKAGVYPPRSVVR